MSKPPFDPNKPFTVVDEVSDQQAAPAPAPVNEYLAKRERNKKPKFDPSKPFTHYIAEGEEAAQATNDEILGNVTRLVAHGATSGFSDEIAGKLAQSVGGDYEKTRDEHRAKLETAREELPLVGPVLEGVGSAATSAAIPVLKGGTVLTELGLAGLDAIGENTDPDTLANDLMWAGGISGVAQGAGKVLKNMVSPPEEILGNSAGARGIDYRKGEYFLGADNADEYADRLKDPAGLAARLDKIGFFGMGKKAFKGDKYVRSGGLEDSISPINMETLMERVQNGLSNLGDHNRSLLKGKRIPVAQLKATLYQATQDALSKGENYLHRAVKAQEIVDTAFEDLMLKGHLQPGASAIDASAVEGLKRDWQKKVAASFESGKSLSDITDVGVELRRKFSTAVDKLVDQYGGPQYAKNNDMMRDFKAVEAMIHNKTSRLRGYSGGGPRLTNLKHLWSSLMENTLFHPQADVARARIGQGLRTPIGQAVEKAITRTPMEWMNGQIDQTPETQVPFRAPNSVPNIPEQFIRTPLPRTTEGLVQNKKFVLGKVAQMAPDMFEAVQDVFDHNPENLPELAQTLAMKMPHFFEKDKYNRFDGRILTEKDKSQAVKDTLLNSKLSSIEQAKIITRLNKEGLYDH